jgi:hypothetical protein
MRPNHTGQDVLVRLAKSTPGMRTLMPRLASGRARLSRFQQFALNALFAVWMLFVILTGQLLPTALTDLLRPDHPIAVVSEPVNAPPQRDSIVEFVPET